jgi:hypothetical protein
MANKLSRYAVYADKEAFEGGFADASFSTMDAARLHAADHWGWGAVIHDNAGKGTTRIVTREGFPTLKKYWADLRERYG